MTEGSTHHTGGQGAPRVLVVQHEDRVPLARWRDAPGLELVVTRPDLGDPVPADLSGYDGLIVLGGTMAAWEDELAPWLPATRALLARAVDDATPVLGICLGAQLLAMATGGTVVKGPTGPELGVVPITVLSEARGDRLLRRAGATFPAPQGHHDAITDLPDGAVLLATSDAYRHQAFRLGECAWGVQYHPEADHETFADWMLGDAEALAATGRTPESVMVGFDAHETDLAAASAAHLQAFADVVTQARAARAPARLEAQGLGRP
ncbi:MAG TPA: type 1 glutamine amidotransferase [Actinomycetales bacterium]|nr:type 1 glutamine amidotransferase [Actinomycetales bacterium]